jgi:hypothetical protein
MNYIRKSIVGLTRTDFVSKFLSDWVVKHQQSQSKFTYSLHCKSFCMVDINNISIMDL